MLLGLTMTVQAPTHAQGFLVNDHRHLVHLAMTAHAADASPDMHGMVEVNVVRRLVDPDPWHRLATRKTRANQFELRAVWLDRLVAVHAGLGRRNLRYRRLLDSCMAI